jgi:hypothetical protein
MNDTNEFFIVMNPACDLAERNGGGCNTDRALLVEIQHIKDVFPTFKFDDLSKNNQNELDKLYKNNKAGYFIGFLKSHFFVVAQ